MNTPDQYSVSDHFAGKDPIVLEVYQHLLIEMRTFGPVVEQPKKTSSTWSTNPPLPGS